MNVEIGTEAAQFPEKEYIIGIFLAVWIEYLLLFVTTMSRQEMNTLPTGLFLRAHKPVDIDILVFLTVHPHTYTRIAGDKDLNPLSSQQLFAARHG